MFSPEVLLIWRSWLGHSAPQLLGRWAGNSRLIVETCLAGWVEQVAQLQQISRAELLAVVGGDGHGSKTYRYFRCPDLRKCVANYRRDVSTSCLIG